MKKLVAWLRQKKPGTIVKVRKVMKPLYSFLGVVPITASLSARVLRKGGAVEDLGVISSHVVTDAFVAQLVDTLQSSEATFSDYKYHDSGTDNTAEAAADTALNTPCGDSRTVGTQTEGATANIYKSVATHTYAGDYVIAEHGLFNANINGTLADRSIFTGISVAVGDKIEFSYSLTCSAGG